MGSAVLFGASTPFARALAGTLDPLWLAGLLYAGSGLGLAFVLLLVAIAIVNRAVLTPPIMAATDSTGVRPLWRSVMVEQGVGILVLASVAWLGTVHPVP